MSNDGDGRTRIYFRLVDQDDGTVGIKMVANPPRDEWDLENLTPAQQLALAAYAGMLDAGEVVDRGTTASPATMEVRSFDVGNN